jgi:uncharacterized membrane protein
VLVTFCVTLEVAFCVALAVVVWFDELVDGDVHPAMQTAATSSAAIATTVTLRFIQFLLFE